MFTAIPYIIAVVVGVLVAYILTRPPELQSMRLSQFILVPFAMILCVGSAINAPLGFPFMIVFLGIVVAPNIAYHGGVALSNFLDNYDWTPTEEELALRPIRLLIEKDSFRQALAELEELLKKHKPTYEAVLIKAKLLNHIGRVDEAVAPLLSLIELSQSTAQQLAVMEMLDFLEKNRQQDPPKPPAPGVRRIEIHHELILFPMAGETTLPHKEIPPGVYPVAEIIHHDRLWLKLADEDWGNAAMCWEAILSINRPPPPPPKKGLLWQIARMHQAITIAIVGKSRRQLLPESQQLFKEATQLIRQEEWQKALPLLQKASACDPDRFEIAYRWMEAVRHTADAAATAAALSRVLQQSQWTKDEEHMFNQLKRPLAK